MDFLANARMAFRELGFTESFYAGDLIGFKAFRRCVSEDVIAAGTRECQRMLHRWGAANSVELDASKEAFHILDTCGDADETFKVLGIVWDCRLSIRNCGKF